MCGPQHSQTNTADKLLSPHQKTGCYRAVTALEVLGEHGWALRHVVGLDCGLTQVLRIGDQEV